MNAEPRLIFLVFLLAGAWFCTFVLLIRALNRLALYQAMMEEARTALKLAAYILVAQDEALLARTRPTPDNREGFQA